jgi:branched-chain amino acid transport system permease protein
MLGFVAQVGRLYGGVGTIRFGKHWQLWMGLFIVAVVWLAPRGLLGVVDRLLGRKRPKA